MTPAQIAAAERHIAAADPVLAPLIARHAPCSIGSRVRDPFHILVTSIISQQLSTKAADTIQKRVEVMVKADPHLQPTHFLKVKHAKMRACGLSNAKARWIVEIARRTHAGAFSFETLASMDDEAAIQALDDLPGIGRWSAEMYLMFGLFRPDIFSLGDLGLRRSVNRLYAKGRKLSDKRTLAIAARWAPWRSVASWYLWRLGDEEPGNWA